MTETWLSSQGDEAKTNELVPSGFDVKSFPSQSRSRGRSEWKLPLRGRIIVGSQSS